MNLCHSKSLIVTIITLIPIIFGACGTGQMNSLPGYSFTCIHPNDCDADGVYASCDINDSNEDEYDLKSGCDNDGDGYVDVACSATELGRDVNGDGFITEEERDVNCDVCPEVYDPEQIDSNNDGIGDECTFEAVEIEDQDTVIEEPSEEFSGDLSATVVDEDSSVRQNSYLDLSLEVSNNSNKTDFEVRVTLRKLDHIVVLTRQARPVQDLPPLSVDCLLSRNGNCFILDDIQEFYIEENTTDTIDLKFKIPQDVNENTYDVIIRIKYRDEDNNIKTVETLNGESITVKKALVIQSEIIDIQNILNHPLRIE